MSRYESGYGSSPYSFGSTRMYERQLRAEKESFKEEELKYELRTEGRQNEIKHNALSKNN